LLSFAARRYSGMGQDFLQAFHLKRSDFFFDVFAERRFANRLRKGDLVQLFESR
jgi:hypothetical protein